MTEKQIIIITSYFNNKLIININILSIPWNYLKIVYWLVSENNIFHSKIKLFLYKSNTNFIEFMNSCVKKFYIIFKFHINIHIPTNINKSDLLTECKRYNLR